MDQKIRISGYEKGTMADGPGIRNVVFFQGCLHNCPGCHNPQTHDPVGGKEQTIDQIVNEINDNEVDVTISGGEPFDQLEGLLTLCTRLKELDKNIWVYTGYTLEELIKSSKLDELRLYIDVLVAGPYIKSLPPKKFAGSNNQKIYYFKGGVLTHYD